jgi:hypothetical protein
MLNTLGFGSKTTGRVSESTESTMTVLVRRLEKLLKLKRKKESLNKKQNIGEKVA